MKRESPDNDRSSAPDKDRSSERRVSVNRPERGRTEVKNANAAGLGAIGREEGKLSDAAAGRGLSEMENEDIY